MHKVEIELVDNSNTHARGATEPQRNAATEPQNEPAEDLINYKGIYFNDNNEKYIDEATGAHFRHEDIYQRLLIAKVERNRTDKELNISYSSVIQTEPSIVKQSPPGQGRQSNQERKYNKRPVKQGDKAPANKTRSSNQNTMGNMNKPLSQNRDRTDKQSKSNMGSSTRQNARQQQLQHYSDDSIDEIHKHQFLLKSKSQNKEKESTYNS